MRKLPLSLVIFALLCMVTTTISAKNVDYWQGKGRIALSSDGNMHDNDDHYATKMTLMILAKAHLQDKVTLYTYSDHIWGSEDNDEAKMKEAAVETGKLFGFNNCNFMAAVEDPEAAYDAMAAEIAKSTADDPLFIIAAGPMQVVGEGFDRANKTNPDALNYVTIISHSTWNENHSDNNGIGSGNNPETEHFGWTWKEMSAKFGTKVNFNHIVDQNGTGTGSEVYTTKDKFAAKSLSEWYFLRDHPDTKVQWVFKSPLVGTGTDYSDAGMAYYFCADLNGVRGDEDGNRAKLEEWLGTDIIDVVVDPSKVWGVTVTPASYTIAAVGETVQLEATIDPETATDKTVTWSSSNTAIATVDDNGLVTAVAKGQVTITVTTNSGSKSAKSLINVGKAEAGEVTVGQDFIAFEAESTTSELGSNWKIVRQGDADYDKVIGGAANGGAYLETTSGKPDGLGVTAGTDMLQYVFTPKTSGAYTLTGRMAQNLKCESGTAWDQCNDIYIKMDGNYTSSTSVSVLNSWNKYYGRGHENATDAKWGAFVQIDVNHAKYQAVYNLKAGEEYTFSISPRSKGVVIDYFILVKSAFTFGEQVDIATENPAKYLPGADVTYVMENYRSVDFEKYTGMGTGFVDAQVDAQRQVLSVADRLKWAAAETTYKGEDANVYVTLNSMLETDGESTFKVFIDGVLIGETTNERIHGTNIADYTIASTRITEEKIAIKNGAKIRVEFNSATNGLVPEDNTTATSRGRWASLVVSTEKNLVDDSDNMVDTQTFAFENTAPWKLWGTDGPYYWETNTGDDVDQFGSTTFHFIGGGASSTYTGIQWMNVNTTDANAMKEFAVQTGDKYKMVMDLKVIEEGVSFYIVLKNFEDEDSSKPLDVAGAWDIISPTTAADNEWQTIERNLDLTAKVVEGEVYPINQVLLITDLGATTDERYRTGEFMLDNIRIIPQDGFTPPSSSIESATVNTFAATAVANTIVVNSDQAQIVNVYSLTGTLVASVAVEEGTTTVASDLAKGIYIVNNTKVVVR